MPITAKKFIIPFVLASLAGHALVIALSTRINMNQSPEPEKVIKVELKAPRDAEKAPSPGRSRPAARASSAAAQAAGGREDSVGLQSPGGPYAPYLLEIRRKIEGLWSYPPQALSQKLEGSAVVRFTIDARGGLNDYYVTSTSGSPILDEGAISVVKAASPFAPLPAAFNLSRLHITATFSYRLTP